MSKIFYIILIILVLISCHKEIEPPTRPIQPPFPEFNELIATQMKSLYLNLKGFDINLIDYGSLYECTFIENDNIYNTIYNSGLLVVMKNNEEYLVSSSFFYTNMQSEDGVFFLHKNAKYSNKNWPMNKDAPVDQNNNPRAYGDGMIWTSLSTKDPSKIGKNYLKNVIEEIIINKAIYAYKLEELQNVIFIKYSIKNNSKKDWNNIQIGYFADLDIEIKNDITYSNYPFNNNYLGFDSTKNISYVYSDIVKNKFPFIGCSFLDTPEKIPIKSHRVMFNILGFKAHQTDDPAFASEKQLFYVVNGLSINGTPMINPTTGLPTKFAFTGNPVTKKGWIFTQPADVRSIITTEPFSLRSGETTWCNLAFVFENETEFANSYDKLLKKFDYIKSNRQLWDFK